MKNETNKLIQNDHPAEKPPMDLTLNQKRIETDTKVESRLQQSPNNFACFFWKLLDVSLVWLPHCITERGDENLDEQNWTRSWATLPGRGVYDFCKHLMTTCWRCSIIPKVPSFMYDHVCNFKAWFTFHTFIHCSRLENNKYESKPRWIRVNLVVGRNEHCKHYELTSSLTKVPKQINNRTTTEQPTAHQLRLFSVPR